MNATAWALIGVAIALAVCDWVAVGTNHRTAEYVFKPATMLPLIAAALVLDPVSEACRIWFVVGLVCSLAGDVFLMLPDDDRRFVAGLASFLLGHVAYIAGFAAGGLSGAALAIGAVVVGVTIIAAGSRIVVAARRTNPEMALPVLVYMVVISAMVAFAIGSTVPVAIVGAAVFALSDFTIGWTRFVKDFPGSRLVVMTTYHAAQVLLVLSLTVAR